MQLNWRTVGVVLLVVAFLGTKVFLLFSGKTGMIMAVLGAIMLIFSESANAGTAKPVVGNLYG